MEELKDLLQKLEGQIPAHLSEVLVEVFDIMSEENKKEILLALHQGVDQTKIIKDFDKERNSILDRGLERMKEIDKKNKDKYKNILKKAEIEEKEGAKKEAEEGLKRI